MIDNVSRRQVRRDERGAMAHDVLVDVAGVVAVAVVIGLRVANKGSGAAHQNWWLVAWLAVGVVDSFGRRRASSPLSATAASALLPR